MMPFPLSSLQVGLAALVVGLGVGGGLAWGWFSPRLDLERQRAAGLAGQLTQQNEAIEALEKSSGERQKLISQLLARAEKERERADRAVEDLRRRPQPVGTDACAAAGALITEELAR